MTIEECYKTFNGDFDGVCARLLNSERVAKFAVRFLETPDFNDLCTAMEKRDWSQAFLHAHTLKGIGLNLGFTDFAKVASDLTEELRGGLKSEDKANMYFSMVSDEYNRIQKGLTQYSS